MKATKYLVVTMAILALVIIPGCGKNSSGSGGSNGAGKNDGMHFIDQVKAPVLDQTLASVSTGDFTIQLPKGWKFEVNPANLQFGMMAYDPQKPERRIFYYYVLNPFMRSDDSHDFWRTYYPASMYASCPVLGTATVEEFYGKWNEYADWLSYQGIRAAIVKFNRIDVVETHPLNNYLSGYAIDSAVVRAHLALENSNLPCEGLFSGAVVSLGSYYQFGIDVSELNVYNVMGVMAPADEFLQLQGLLLKSLQSFSFTDNYVRSYLQSSQESTQAILENARTMQAACESSAAAWHNRQPANDAISQKNSDGTLGYDRLYDADTGEVIRADIGWYDMYNLNRSEYNKANIYKLEDNDYDRYSQAIDYYIHK